MGGTLAEQARLNAATRDQWDAYGDHRRRLTGLVLARAPLPGARLCVLGAGNANDLDLAALSAGYAEIDLVDADGAALAHAVSRQPVAGVRAVGGVDLTGIADRLDAAAPFADCAAGLAAFRPGWNRRAYDVVLSAGLLSQLVLGAIRARGEHHAELPALLDALRRQHVRLLLDLAGPGGQALLVTDLVSSDTVPDLARTPADSLKARMVALIEHGNFFTGLNPYALLKSVGEDADLTARIGEAHLLRPWLWHMGARRCYLVYAILLLPAQASGRTPPGQRAKSLAQKEDGG